MAASKQGRTYVRTLTHFRNAVPLVWGSLRLAPISFSPAGHPVPIYVIQPLTSPGTPNCTYANVARDSDCHVSMPGHN